MGKLKMRNPLTWVQWAVFISVLAVLITSATVLFVELVPMAQATERAHFTSEATALSVRLNNTAMRGVLPGIVVRDHIQAVVETQMAYNETDPRVHRADFQNAVSAFLGNPTLYLRALVYIQVVENADRARWEQIGREEYNNPNFVFTTPVGNGSVKPSPTKGIYYPQMYVSPEKDFLPLAGMDIGYETVRMKALTAALANGDGKPVASDPIRLTQIDGNMGIAVFTAMNAPTNGTGLVATVFDFGAMMRNVLQYRINGESPYPLNVVLWHPATGQALFIYKEFGAKDAEVPNETSSNTLHTYKMPFAEQELVLYVYRPSYGVSTLVVVVYALLMLTAFALAGLVVWQMKLLQRLKRNHKRTVEEKAKRMAAEQSSQMKSSFLSFMSHELRTPLHGVVGCGDLLKQTKLTAEQIDYVNIMHACADMLLRIISDILDYQKIEASLMTLEEDEFSLFEMMKKVFMMARVGAQKAGVRLVMEANADVDEFFIGDALRIQQILANYLSNAIKFTPPGGSVVAYVGFADAGGAMKALGRKTSKSALLVSHDSRSKLRYMPSTNGTVLEVGDDALEVGDGSNETIGTGKRTLRFHVHDTGIGITQEDLPMLFQPFTQADPSVTRVFGGTGLGLSLCRSLSRLMGGDAWATSEHGKGSDFYFTVQVTPAQKHASLSPRPCLVYDPAASDGKSRMRPTGIGGVPPMSLEIVPTRSVVPLASSSNPTMAPSGWDDLAATGGAGEKNHSAPAGVNPFPVAHENGDVAVVDLGNASHTQGNGVNSAGLERTPRSGSNSSQRTPRSGSNSEKLSVLLADDDPMSQKVNSTMLRSYGLNVYQAWNGAEAVGAAETQRFSVIILDVNMPDLSGITAARAIRAGSTNKTTPLIAFTADARSECREEALAAGMDDVLVKPCTMHKLAEVLCKFIPTLSPQPRNASESAPVEV